jgi:hypothetical protein
VLLIGECKTFDHFKEKDVRRMQALAQHFPRAAIAFCTLRNKLSVKERHLIGRLALKGRKLLAADHWRDPVLVLTATELLAKIGIPHCWKDLTGPAKNIVDAYRGFQTGYEGIQELANCLQQMYLGIESYDNGFAFIRK